MEIPESIKDVLRCVECNELLSCGPVFLIHETNAAICGRCSPQTSNQEDAVSKLRSRNLQYEAAAKLLLFPCRYSNQGCREKLNFSEQSSKMHEHDCKYRNFFCPIVSSRSQCSWVGSRQKLSEHCREFHPSHYFQNPCVLPRPDLSNSNLGNFLVFAFNFLFLVHVKICVESGKFFHSVRMFGDSKYLDKFSYSLEIEGNGKKFTQSSSVLHARVLTLQGPTASFTTIGSLMEFLDDDSVFKITIGTLTQICQYCFQHFEQITNSRFCDECARKFIKCEFSRRNCSFVDENRKKCGKHEFYFCEYQKKCFRCGVYFNNGSFIEHLGSPSSCSNTIKTSIDKVVRLSPNGDNNFNFLLLSSENIGTVICSYDLFNSNLYLRIFTPLSSHELKGFKCSIELVDPQTKHTVLLMPQIKYKTCDDWFIDEKINNFPSWKHVGIDVKINIDKV